MDGSADCKSFKRGFHQRSHGWHGSGSPWMGVVALFVLFIIVSKGFLLPLLFMFGLYMLFVRNGRPEGWGHMSWGDEWEKPKNDRKRKNDADDDDTVYYV